jgi:hypothetical protein
MKMSHGSAILPNNQTNNEAKTRPQHQVNSAPGSGFLHSHWSSADPNAFRDIAPKSPIQNKAKKPELNTKLLSKIRIPAFPLVQTRSENIFAADFPSHIHFLRENPHENQKRQLDQDQDPLGSSLIGPTTPEQKRALRFSQDVFGDALRRSNGAP